MFKWGIYHFSGWGIPLKGVPNIAKICVTHNSLIKVIIITILLVQKPKIQQCKTKDMDAEHDMPLHYGGLWERKKTHKYTKYIKCTKYKIHIIINLNNRPCRLSTVGQLASDGSEARARRVKWPDWRLPPWLSFFSFKRNLMYIEREHIRNNAVSVNLPTAKMWNQS